MERNADIYVPREKALAFHPQPGCPTPSQWWYHDANFDNGYSISLNFHANEKMGMIQFEVGDPQGKVTSVSPLFDPKAIIASTEVCDVKLGENYMRGKYPRYDLHVREGGLGADLVFKCITKEFMEPPDGVFMGREQTPATPKYFAYIFRPRCEVTGKLIVDGKEIPVKGQGYGDHQWSNVSVADLFHCWYWGKIFLPKHTIYWWFAQMPPDMGYERMKWLWVFKGDKLIEYLAHADMYYDFREVEVDPETGIAVPRKMVIDIDERRIKGTATFNRKYILYKTPMRPPRPIGWNRYFRQVANCRAKFDIEGEKAEVDYQEVYEVGL